MDFEAFYDSSGRGGDQPATTLAGVAASKHVWDQFEPLWQKALDDCGVPERLLSMADLMSSQGRFEGWDGTRKEQLLTALFNVLAKFRPLGMSVYSCTVFFHAYDAAKVQVPKLRKLEAICVNHCVGGLQLTAERPAGQQLNLYLFFVAMSVSSILSIKYGSDIRGSEKDGRIRCETYNPATTRIMGYKPPIFWHG